jgi:hypothetical protein
MAEGITPIAGSKSVELLSPARKHVSLTVSDHAARLMLRLLISPPRWIEVRQVRRSRGFSSNSTNFTQSLQKPHPL